jgi:hypothetical protein
MHITRVPIITFTDMKQSCSANEHHMYSLVLFVCLFWKTALFSLKQVLSNFYAISFLWRRCNFRGKCRARYCDVAKTTCGIRQSNYLPLLLYRIPLKTLRWSRLDPAYLNDVTLFSAPSISIVMTPTIVLYECIVQRRYLFFVKLCFDNIMSIIMKVSYMKSNTYIYNTYLHFNVFPYFC